jgi:micrococcal nuclease
MRNYFWEDYKNFFAIIIAALIIGAFVYFGIKNNSQPDLSIQKIQTAVSPKNLSVQNQIKSDFATQNSGATACGASENTIVTKVIDGDTVVVEGGWHVRLLGMDADEKGYPCYDAAKTRLEDLVLSKQVVLEKDISDVDQYGRCLRYIFLGNTNIDLQLVQEGLAVARFYSPDVKYRAAITDAESYAQENKVGCKWSGAAQTAN